MWCLGCSTSTSSSPQAAGREAATRGTCLSRGCRCGGSEQHFAAGVSESEVPFSEIPLQKWILTLWYLTWDHSESLKPGWACSAGWMWVQAGQAADPSPLRVLSTTVCPHAVPRRLLLVLELRGTPPRKSSGICHKNAKGIREMKLPPFPWHHIAVCLSW